MTPSKPTDALADLRGYHLPAPVDWWPPAPGWWLLASLLLVLAAVSTWLWLRRRRRRAALRAALAELDALSANRDAMQATEFVRGLSRLLRRYALARFPRQQVAGLAGDDWLAFLDAHGSDGAFARGSGRLLREAPYQRVADSASLDELAALVRGWISRNAEPGRA